MIANIATGLVAASITASGFYLGRIPTTDPLLPLAKLTAQIAAPILGYLAARKVQIAHKAQIGSVIVGMVMGCVMGVETDQILKHSLSLILITGTVDCLSKVL